MGQEKGSEQYPQYSFRSCFSLYSTGRVRCARKVVRTSLTMLGMDSIGVVEKAGIFSIV